MLGLKLLHQPEQAGPLIAIQLGLAKGVGLQPAAKLDKAHSKSHRIMPKMHDSGACMASWDVALEWIMI